MTIAHVYVAAIHHFYAMSGVTVHMKGRHSRAYLEREHLPYVSTSGLNEKELEEKAPAKVDAVLRSRGKSYGRTKMKMWTQKHVQVTKESLGD